MSSVDDRIVNMQFNNKQFTAGAAESQKALTDLDRTLANTGKSGGLTTMGSAVDGISSKFSAMQVAGVTALATVVAKATSAGLGIIKSLSLDPILQGFQEYQTNLNSIQTVMSNTGKSVDVVNGYMNKLNHYSDLTIYNFSEMARNIGTFTAAGVDLKTATASIQGIANLAALSGSNSQQASTAMYQLSQAIAAGRVGLQDWNSVVNAGMGGKVFQTALAQNAVAMGQLNASAVDFGGTMGKLTVNGESFRQSISAAGGAASWLSGDVLTKTLSLLDGRLSQSAYEAKGFSAELAAQKVAAQQAKLANEGYSKATIKSMTDTANKAYESATVVKSLPQLFQVVQESIGSLWSNSFAIVLGNFNQSKHLWTSVSNEITGTHGILTKMTNAWTSTLRNWSTAVDKGGAGGRTQILKGMRRMASSISAIFGALKGAFTEVFPPSSLNILSKMSKGFNQFTKILKVHSATADNLKNIFGGFFAVLHIGFTILQGVGKAVFNFFDAISQGSDKTQGGVLSLFGNIGALLIKLDKWITSGGKLVDVMGSVGTVVGTFVQPFVQGIGLVISSIATLVGGGGIRAVTDQFQSAGDTFSGFTGIVNSGLRTLQSFFSSFSLGSFSVQFDKARTAISALIQSGGGLEGIFKNIGQAAGGATAGGLQIASGIIGGLAAGISAAAPEVWAAITALAGSIVDTFKSVLGIHSPSTAMIDPGTDVIRGIIVGIMNGMKLVGKAIAAVGGFLRDAFTQLFGDMDALDFAALINSIISGGFLLALTNILNTFGSSGFFAGFANIFDQLGNSLQAFQQNLKAQALLAIGTAVALLVGSLVLLALLDPKQIGQGLGTIAIMMALLVGSMSALSKSTKGGVTLVFISGALNEMATAIVILAGAIALLGNLDPDTISQGLTTMAIAMALMVGAARALSGISGQLVAAGASMILMATALQALAVAVLLFGKLKPDVLAQGMTSVAIGIALMVGGLRALGTVGPSIILAGGAMVLMAAALQGLAVVIFTLGKMDPKVLSQGMKAMAISIGLMVVSLGALALLGPEVLLAAQAMIVMSAAMVIMAHAVGTFGAMDPDAMKQGFIGVAIGLGLLLAAAAVAAYVAPGLLALGVSVALLGAGVALAGAGMLAFATALGILSVVGVAAIAVMVVAIEAFTALLPSIAVQVAASFVSFLQTIAEASPKVREAFDTIFKNMLGVITDNIPVITRLLQALIDAGISVIRNTVPQWVEMGLTVVTKFLEGVAKKIPQIADSALQMIQDFLTVIDNHLGNIIDKGTDIIVHLLRGIAQATAKISDAMGKMILDMLSAIDAAIVKYDTPIRNEGLKIIGHLIDAMTGGLAGKITDAIGGAIKDGLSHIDLSSAASGIVSAATGGLLGRAAAGGRGVGGGQPFSKGKGAGHVFGAAAQAAVNAALGLVGSHTTSSADPQTLRKAGRAQAHADQQSAEAIVADQLAKEAEKKAAKKGAGAAAKAKAKKLRNEADKQARQAERAQNAADAAAQRVQDSADFNDADLHGKGDIRSEQAQSLAEKANKLMDKANVEAAKAKDLMQTNKKAGQAMLKQAQKDAKAAKQLADAAKKADAEAQGYYTDEVRARIKQIEDDAAAEEQQKKDDAAYEAADNAGKAKIMSDRAAADEAKAAAAKAEAQRLIDLAKQFAESDPQQAMEYLDQAEEAAAAAKEAADKAEQERQQAEQLVQQGTSSGGGGNTTSGPSKSVLEDAARAVDRYTASLREAEGLSGATEQVVQYNQNIYAPSALPASDIYRHSKNLVAAQELKMRLGPGGPPVEPKGGGPYY